MVAAQTMEVAALIKMVAGADAIITQFAPINADVIAAMDKARVIVRYGIGFDNVDIEAARAKNIPVCNIPDYCIDEVADHTLAFILGLTRQVATHTNKVHGGGWGLATGLDGLQALCRMTVGVVGFGRIGRAVVRRLLAFGCKVLVHDPVVPAATIAEAGATSVDLPTLLAQSDCVTLHCPSLPQTKNLINRQSLAGMKDGALLINLEPIPQGHPILNRPNVILAPHIASASVAAVNRLRQSAARLAVDALAGKHLGSVVNGVTT
jgi:D-3-phosphoglycerate dehydrogenase